MSILSYPAVRFIRPDGTLSVNQPTDGEIFYVWDLNSLFPREVWQWDNNNLQWLDITGSTSGYCIDDTFNLAEEFQKMTQQGEKCECGSESVGSTKHSTWCKKWSSDS